MAAKQDDRDLEKRLRKLEQASGHLGTIAQRIRESADTISELLHLANSLFGGSATPVSKTTARPPVRRSATATRRATPRGTGSAASTRTAAKAPATKRASAKPAGAPSPAAKRETTRTASATAAAPKRAAVTRASSSPGGRRRATSAGGGRAGA